MYQYSIRPCPYCGDRRVVEKCDRKYCGNCGKQLLPETRPTIPYGADQTAPTILKITPTPEEAEKMGS